jgi:hypothetical protein
MYAKFLADIKSARRAVEKLLCLRDHPLIIPLLCYQVPAAAGDALRAGARRPASARRCFCNLR